MIRLSSGSPEWVRGAQAEVDPEGMLNDSLMVGAMIETPRAALRARDRSRCRFLSFGTNDLTQMTFGLSRDDVEADCCLDTDRFDSWTTTRSKCLIRLRLEPSLPLRSQCPKREALNQHWRLRRTRRRTPFDCVLHRCRLLLAELLSVSGAVDRTCGLINRAAVGFDCRE